MCRRRRPHRINARSARTARRPPGRRQYHTRGVAGRCLCRGSGSRLFVVLDRTLTLLRQHLDDEERHVVPLMEQHITAKEWDDLVQEGSADADQAQLPLMFGMLMYEGDPRSSSALWPRCPPTPGRSSGRSHADVHRALPSRPRHPTPPRNTELTGAPTCLTTDTI